MTDDFQMNMEGVPTFRDIQLWSFRKRGCGTIAEAAKHFKCASRQIKKRIDDEQPYYYFGYLEDKDSPEDATKAIFWHDGE
jgi:hypothetical protein